MVRPAQDVTDAELAVLEVIWQEEPVTARRIQEVLYPDAKDSQHGTIQKLLDRLKAKKFVACGNQYIVTVECNAAQVPVGAAALEVYIALVPVDMLLNFLFLKIDRKYAAVTLALPAATHDGCRDERR